MREADWNPESRPTKAGERSSSEGSNRWPTWRKQRPEAGSRTERRQRRPVEVKWRQRSFLFMAAIGAAAFGMLGLAMTLDLRVALSEEASTGATGEERLLGPDELLVKLELVICWFMLSSIWRR